MIYVLAALAIGVTIGLFGLSFWHASNCSPTALQSEVSLADQTKEFKRRILEAESMVIKNSILTEKVLLHMQSRLISIENYEMELLTKQSQEQAVEVTLELAGRPAPLTSEFKLLDQYKDAEILADFIDDVFLKVSNGEEIDQSQNDKVIGDTVAVSDIEAERACREWKETHNVVVGVSWGNLPQDLQKKWMDYSCDYHLDSKL